MGLAENHLGRANIVLGPVLDRETAGRKIVAIATETETTERITGIATETEIVIAIVVIVAEDRDQETGETATEKETLIMRETPGIAGTEIGTETEEGNDRSRRLHFPEQDRHLEKVSAPLELETTS